MATCKDCLEQIVWVDRSDGMGKMPCQYVDMRGTGLYVLIHGTLRIAMPTPPVVLRHRCDQQMPFPELQIVEE